MILYYTIIFSIHFATFFTFLLCYFGIDFTFLRLEDCQSVKNLLDLDETDKD